MSQTRVSIVIPCRNEQKYIQDLLEALDEQDYQDELEVVIVDDHSTDGTRRLIEQWVKDHGENRLLVRVISNSGEGIPAALNEGIAQAQSPIIIRMDAHAKPDANYVSMCLAALKKSRAQLVGGVWLIRPSRTTLIAQAIALTVSHPFGAGDSLYRYGAQAGPQVVDTVPFGCFKKAVWDRVGRYDENLKANEDYDFAYRIRRAGGTVYFDPAIRSTYYARHNLRALGRQYFRYGWWKAKMLRKWPESLRIRQIIPLTFTLTLITLAGSSLFYSWGRWALSLLLSIYLLAMILACVDIGLRRHAGAKVAALPLCFVTVHLSYGTGLLLGCLSNLQRNSS
ncbi:MAG: glycosyltransferase family 2 protein [Chitinophagales bacterium]